LKNVFGLSKIILLFNAREVYLYPFKKLLTSIFYDYPKTGVNLVSEKIIGILEDILAFHPKSSSKINSL